MWGRICCLGLPLLHRMLFCGRDGSAMKLFEREWSVGWVSVGIKFVDAIDFVLIPTYFSCLYLSVGCQSVETIADLLY